MNNVVIDIWGFIDSWWTNADMLKRQLDKIAPSDSITFRIHCYGGNVYEGTAIHSLIKALPNPTEGVIFGICASMGTVIASACKKVSMYSGAIYMVHAPSADTWEYNKTGHQKAIDMLDSVEKSMLNIYVGRTGIDEKTFAKKYFDGNDHYLTADEALSENFIDSIVDKLPKGLPDVEEIDELLEDAKEFVEMSMSMADEDKNSKYKKLINIKMQGTKEKTKTFVEMEVDLDKSLKDLQALQAKNAEIEAKISDLEVKNTELVKANQDLITKNTELSAKNVELATGKATGESLSSVQTTAFQEKINGLTTANSSLSNEKDNLAKELEAKNLQILALKEQNKEIAINSEIKNGLDKIFSDEPADKIIKVGVSASFRNLNQIDVDAQGNIQVTDIISGVKKTASLDTLLADYCKENNIKSVVSAQSVANKGLGMSKNIESSKSEFSTDEITGLDARSTDPNRRNAYATKVDAFKKEQARKGVFAGSDEYFEAMEKANLLPEGHTFSKEKV